MRVKSQKYTPTVTVSVQKRVYDPATKKNRYPYTRSFTVRDAEVDKVYQLLLKAMEKEAHQ